MALEIIRSKYAGACYGVKRALELVEAAAAAAADAAACAATNTDADTAADTADATAKAAAGAATGAAATPGPSAGQRPTIHTLGPLIHNPQVVSELQARGVEVAADVADVQQGTLVLRSHGVAPEVVAAAEAKGLQVVDATCPHVSKAQEAARELGESGNLVIIVGEPGHPEVEAIRAYAGEHAIIIQDPQMLSLEELPPEVGVVVQTTQSAEALAAVLDALTAHGVQPQVRNTICFATSQRQQAARELAAQVDVMVVVGGRNSGNTTRLAQICEAVCPRTWHIESPDELRPEWFTNACTVGVTAGASTPEQQIIAVEQVLAELGSSQ
ncbi:MAG: 4-hydroxy-3-methylbut-2-enyl diphosphate reductase [Coriobacteriales bacterium]|jgi:4-hydroxy-3-methylbut-2-enyl diphosphate reductase|nr:4-hydroxy-3-methylbut-2-enyl diphosphate reductase [Coriobacteriales bacterium]